MEQTPGSSSDKKEQTIIASDEIHQIMDLEKNLDGKFQVKHGFFKWSIENFPILPDTEDMVFYSPIFQLKETWWYLTLCPHVKISGRDFVSLGLVRHESDPAPNYISVSYALGLENSLNKIWFKAEENILFMKGKHNKLQTSVLGNLQNFLSERKENDDDTFSVVCEIYVAYQSDKRSKSAGKTSPIDQSLSLDLINLFESKKKAGVSIETRNGIMWAHKSILCARSRTLARLLENGKFFIQLSCSISCLKCVLVYMYSGNLDCLLKNANFSIGLYELACELSLPNLRDMLTPHKIGKKYRVKVSCFERKCTIDGFYPAKLSSQKVEMPVDVDRESGISVKIVLYKLNSPAECVGVDAEIDGVDAKIEWVDKAFYTQLDVFFLNKNCVPLKEVRMKRSEDSPMKIRNSVLFVSFVISNANFQSSIDNGYLCISFKCTNYFMKNVLDTPASLMSLSHDCNNWIEELSSDLKELFQSGKLSDIKLVVEDQEFRVHRSILAARSRFFYALCFENNYRQDTFNINGTESRIFGILLTYIYCGTISHIHGITTEDFSKLARVSQECGIQSLVDICSQFLNQLP